MSEVPPEQRSIAQAALQQRGFVTGVVGGGTIGRAHPNPDTFSGLLARFDLYLAALSEAEQALEDHADRLIAPDKTIVGKVDDAINGRSDAPDDSTAPVISRLQARLDRMASLTSQITQHHGRANRVF